MPVYNREKYLQEAVESVLSQLGVDFELIVVDDGSTDDTAKIIDSFIDPRIIKIKNEKNMGISYCHNLVIEKSRAPFIAHVDSDDVVLPGALYKILQKIKSSTTIGLVHCYSFFTDKNGKMTRDSFRARRKWLLSNINPSVDYKQVLMRNASAANGLRTYRKEVFKIIGKFDEGLRVGEDYDLAMRLIDKFDIKLVPEYLYSIRIHDNNTTSYPYFKNLRSWHQKIVVRLRLFVGGKVEFIREKKYFIHILGIRELINIIKSAPPCGFISRNFKIFKRKCLFFVKFVLFPPLGSIYYWSVNNFSWWPIGIKKPKVVQKEKKDRRIAYYLWHYPVLSQTFIQREVLALKEVGIFVQVIAEGSKDILNNNLRYSMEKDTKYLFPQDKKLLSKYIKLFFLKNPLRFLNLFLYVVFHYYSGNKNIQNDFSIFFKSIYLAGTLNDNNIDHIHSPWADLNAFVALVASRFAGIPYSVEARAYDIYSKTSSFILPAKLNNAEFVITNCNYNKSYLGSFLDRKQQNNLNVIYEGLKLDEFIPCRKKFNSTKEYKILTVARLVEQKGLIYLVKACKILKDRGYKFKCEIVGGAEGSAYNCYVELKKTCLDLNLGNEVVFSGPQPFINIMDRYNGADIFVLPCVITKEGVRDITPNSLLEAMAMKLPVISTSISAIPEIVDHNISGILVPPGNEVILAEEIMRLIGDKKLRLRLGENARKKIEEKFNMNKNIGSFVNLFLGDSDITAVVLTTGEDTYTRAVRSIKSQTLLPKEVITINKISPFYKAINLGASKVKTDFFVQVDSDMILDKNCLKNLRENFSADVGVVVGFLSDPLVGRISGVKMFRTKCFDEVKFKDSLSPDTDFSGEILKSGWKTVFLYESYTLGEHKRNYTPRYTYSKYLLAGKRYVYRKKFIQFQQLVRILGEKNNQISLIARVALMHGVFQKPENNLLSSQQEEEDFFLLNKFVNNRYFLRGLFKLFKIKSLLNNNFNREDANFIINFIKGNYYTENVEKVFERFFQLGVLSRRLSWYFPFKYFINILGRSSDILSSVALISLCHGIFFTGFDKKLIMDDIKLLETFMTEIKNNTNI